jgi:ABC-type transporter Mla maintaining outer membrane lipid asymmetry ATPase subunit MlaF
MKELLFDKTCVRILSRFVIVAIAPSRHEQWSTQPPTRLQRAGSSGTAGHFQKFWQSNKLLDNIDLTIYRGEAVAIIGPSGTGKSTILRIIAGLLPADSGEIYVQGQKREGLIEDSSDPISIGMVFQQAALFDSLTVEENVGFLLYQHSRLPTRALNPW